MKLFLFAATFLILIGCQKPTTVTFADLTDVSKIEKVEILNNSGKFQLSENQLSAFKNDIAKLEYVPGFAAKVGPITLLLTIEGKQHQLLTATHGEYLEAHKDVVMKNQNYIGDNEWLYFKTNGVNFDNYKKE